MKNHLDAKIFTCLDLLKLVSESKIPHGLLCCIKKKLYKKIIKLQNKQITDGTGLVTSCANINYLNICYLFTTLYK